MLVVVGKVEMGAGEVVGRVVGGEVGVRVCGGVGGCWVLGVGVWVWWVLVGLAEGEMGWGVGWGWSGSSRGLSMWVSSSFLCRISGGSI